ncbi:MAG: ROK family protein [Clostridia bacterium]|nr:ROK family protein [Clostridia bacterium]
MKKENTAHFEQVKIQNKKAVRNLLREQSPLSIAKVAEEVGLSYPTVSALLKELTIKGEALVSIESESCGGRPGICYELNPDYQYALTLRFDDDEICAGVYDAYGRRVRELSTLKADGEISPIDLVNYVRNVKAEFETLSAVSIGVAGTVYEDEITYLPKFPKLEGKQLSELLKSELELEVFIENDINAVCYAEAREREDFAHIVYMEEDKCIGVGIVMNGEIVRGSHGYAGELEYLCRDQTEVEEILTTAILALTCVLNLPDLLLSGGGCSKTMIEHLDRRLKDILPCERVPKLYVIEKMNHYYEKGLIKRVLTKWACEE